MDMNESMNERLSALADGELQGENLSSVLRHAATEQGQSRWRLYHEIGDALRHSEPPMAHDPGLLERLRCQLAEEPRPRPALAQTVTGVAQPGLHAANAPLWRWKMVAGLASLVAVAAVAWDVYVGAAPEPAGAQLAQSEAQPNRLLQPAPAQSLAPAPEALAAAVENGAAEAPVMLRDPRLDEWLAEHSKNAGVAVLQAPAGFLRNANFDAPRR